MKNSPKKFNYNFIDSQKFLIRDLKSEYKRNKIIDYIVLDNFIKKEHVADIAKEHNDVPEEYWLKYNHFNQKKMGISDLTLMGNKTQSLIEELSSKPFTNWLNNLTGFKNLISDPDLDGGGLHKISTGGYLNIHTDFQNHTKNKNWKRRLNLLLYLTPEYKDSWNGNLELRDYRDQSVIESISPKFNRCIIFTTNKKSFHGHPLPLTPTDDLSRRSLALYYFEKDDKALPLKPTFYVANPNDKFMKKILIRMDVYALYFFSLLKRYTKVDNKTFDKIRKILFK